MCCDIDFIKKSCVSGVWFKMAVPSCFRGPLGNLKRFGVPSRLWSSCPKIPATFQQKNRIVSKCTNLWEEEILLQRWDANGSVCRRMYSHRAAERPCWKCGKDVKGETELFFCKCGMVQAPDKDVTYFDLFGIPLSFDVDLKDLSVRYKELQWKLHPDKFTRSSETEKEHAADQSALVNKAYKTLQKPLSRALYLLAEQGCHVEEANTQTDPEFLMEVMEVNEAVDNAKTAEEMEPHQTTVSGRINQFLAQLSTAFTSGDLDAAKDITLRYKYYDSIDERIREFFRRQH